MTGRFSARLSSFAHATKMQPPGLADTGPDEAHLDAAMEWLHHSCDVSPASGSAATYNLLLGWEEPYPETTGYIVRTFYAYADRTVKRDAADRATTMAEWLLETQLPCGGFPDGTGTSGDPSVFNTGQIVLGLAAAYARTGDEAFAEAVVDACDWLCDIQDETGSWSQHDYRSETHVYTTRVAWALLEAAQVAPARAEGYTRAARRNLQWAVAHQRANGWFEKAAFERDERPFLHTIAYTIRGLLEGSRLLDDEELFRAANRAADALLDVQQSGGILKGEYDEDWAGSWYYCLPGNAQMGLVWARLHQLTGDEAYLLAARNTAEFLKRHQPLTGPQDVRGALPGSYPYFGRYVFLRYPNWGAKFLADLLLALDEIAADENAAADEAPVERPTPERPVQNGGTADVCRVCLLVDGESIERWTAEAIERMLVETNAEISLVVVNEDAGLLGTENVKRGLKYPTYAAYWLASHVAGTLSDEASFDDSAPLSEVPGVADAEWVRTYPANVDGLWCQLPDEVVARISASADVVVRRGFGLLRGDVLTATAYGVLSYHHGDPREYRGGPAGFWEFMHDRSRAGVMVQTLRENLDAGAIQAYDDVDIADCDSWRAVRERLYTDSTHLLAEAVEAVQDPDSEPMRVEDPGPVYYPPSTTGLGRFAVKRVLNL